MNNTDNKNSRLGKGLSTLLGDKKYSVMNNGTTGADKAKDGVVDLDLSNISVNENQPRKFFSKEKLDELIISIKTYGVLQPIIVRPKDGHYEIVAGERRFRAAKCIGLEKIPAIIKEFSDDEAYSLSIIENIQREDLNCIEEANAYKELINRYNYTQQEIAGRVGKSRSHIANLLRLLSLPSLIQGYLVDNKIEMGHARALIGFEYALDVIDYIIENNLSVRDVENLVKSYSKDIVLQSKKKKVEPLGEDFMKELNSRNEFLREKLNLNCNISFNSKKNEGVIKIKYSSLEDLDNLLNKIKE